MNENKAYPGPERRAHLGRVAAHEEISNLKAEVDRLGAALKSEQGENGKLISRLAERSAADIVELGAGIANTALEHAAQAFDSGSAFLISKNEVQRRIRALKGVAAPAAPSSPEIVAPMTITLRQARNLVAFFGGHDCEVTVIDRPDAWGTPPGLYAYCTEEPGEGSEYLGATEVDDDLARIGAATAIEARSVRDDPIRQLIAHHAELLEANPYCYFELAHTRHTGWMAWLCTNSIDLDKDRKVIARGQSETAEGACSDALSAVVGQSGKALTPERGEGNIRALVDAHQATSSTEPWSDAEREVYRQSKVAGAIAQRQAGQPGQQCPICHDTGTAFGKACTCPVGVAIAQMHKSTGLRCQNCCTPKGEPHLPSCPDYVAPSN